MPKPYRTDWETPQWLFDLLHEEFRFDLDACATVHNAKCTAHLVDALARGDWPGESVFMNPPYGHGIAPFIERAAIEGRKRTVVCLVPNRTEAR